MVEARAAEKATSDEVGSSSLYAVVTGSCEAYTLQPATATGLHHLVMAVTKRFSSKLRMHIAGAHPKWTCGPFEAAG